MCASPVLKLKVGEAWEWGTLVVVDLWQLVCYCHVIIMWFSCDYHNRSCMQVGMRIGATTTSSVLALLVSSGICVIQSRNMPTFSTSFSVVIIPHRHREVASMMALIQGWIVIVCVNLTSSLFCVSLWGNSCIITIWINLCGNKLYSTPCTCSAFNNVWSNFGYVALGVLFFIIVAIRYVMWLLCRITWSPCDYCVKSCDFV